MKKQDVWATQEFPLHPFSRHHPSHINLHHHELVFYVLVFDSGDLTGCTLLYQALLPSPMLLEVDIICSFYCCNASTSFTLNHFSPGGHVRWFHFRVGSYCHQLPVPSQVEPPQAITIGQTSSSNQNEGSWPTNDLGCVYSSNAEVLTRQAFSVKGHIVNSFDFASHVIFMAHTDSATYKQYVKRYMFTPIHLQLEKTGGGKIRWVKLWSGQISFLVNAFEVIESLGSCSLLWDPSPLFPNSFLKFMIQKVWFATHFAMMHSSPPSQSNGTKWLCIGTFETVNNNSKTL